MKTIKYLLCVLFIVMGMASLSSCCYPSPWKDAKEINQFPKIFPDYVGVTVPAISHRSILTWRTRILRICMYVCMVRKP